MNVRDKKLVTKTAELCDGTPDEEIFLNLNVYDTVNMASMDKDYKDFNIGSFNVRGLSEKLKQQSLVSDIIKYNVDVCCIQETKNLLTTRKDLR